MWLALFLVITTLPVSVTISRRELFRSQLLSLAFSWFAGQFLAGLAICQIASLLSAFSGGLLGKAVWIYSLLCAIWLAWNWRAFSSAAVEGAVPGAFRLGIASLPAFAVPLLIFPQHIGLCGQFLCHSHAYGDFAAHYPLVQTFVLGDNFPPSSEGCAGMPMMYHFYYSLLLAIYSVIGAGFPEVFTVGSVLTTGFLMLLLLGLCEELSGSRAAGVWACVLFLTQASLRFINEVISVWQDGIADTWAVARAAAKDPYAYGFLSGGAIPYNGNMYNLYYLVAERHLIFACGLLLCAMALVHARHRFGHRELVGIGSLMGLVFFWHLYAAIAIGGLLVLLVAIGPRKSHTISLCTGFAVLFVLQVLPMAYLFLGRDTADLGAPIVKFNTAFFAMKQAQDPAFYHYLGSILFGYGVKPLVAWQGFRYLRSRDPEGARILGLTVCLLFLLINSVSIAGLSVLNNHKFLKPMDMLIDILAGIELARMVAALRPARWLLAAPLVLLLTASGLIENVPYYFSRSDFIYSFYPSPIAQAVEKNSLPRDVFQSDYPREILLAGRRLFFARGSDMGRANSFFMGYLWLSRRYWHINRIYRAPSLRELCSRTRANRIDFLEFDETRRKLPVFALVETLPRFEVHTGTTVGKLVFVEVKACSTNDGSSVEN